MSDNQTLETLAVIERGDSEQVRLTLDAFTSDDGKEHVYCSARKWYRKDDGQWCPTKAGLTIRKTELMQWGKTLRAALDSMNAPPQRPSKSREPALREGESVDDFGF